MKIETLALSVTYLLAVIVRSEVAGKTTSMASPFEYGTIESGGGGGTVRAS